MSSNTKIIVLKSKELIYTGIFLLLGALLILLLFYMFSNNKHDDASSEDTGEIVSSEASPTSAMVHYTPGTYSSDVNLAGSNLHMVVTVEEDKISHVAIENLSETITVMYPLLSPSLDEINANLPYANSIDDITFSGDNQYTTLLLVDAIKQAVEPAICEK